MFLSFTVHVGFVSEQEQWFLFSLSAVQTPALHETWPLLPYRDLGAVK